MSQGRDIDHHAIPSAKIFFVFLKHFLKIELGQISRLFSLLMFAVTVLLLFFFCFETSDRNAKVSMFVSQSVLGVFLALQLCYLRIFEPEQEDQAFQLLRILPIKAEIWFTAKLIIVVVLASLVALFVLGSSLFFHQELNLGAHFLELGFVLILAIFGLSPVGVLLSAMMLRSHSKQIIFPLLYFPLSVPVLLASTQLMFEVLLKSSTVISQIESWLGLLIVFDFLYLVLSYLFFGELLKAE